MLTRRVYDDHSSLACVCILAPYCAALAPHAIWHPMPFWHPAVSIMGALSAEGLRACCNERCFWSADAWIGLLRPWSGLDIGALLKFWWGLSAVCVILMYLPACWLVHTTRYGVHEQILSSASGWGAPLTHCHPVLHAASLQRHVCLIGPSNFWRHCVCRPQQEDIGQTSRCAPPALAQAMFSLALVGIDVAATAVNLACRDLNYVARSHLVRYL